MIKAPNSKHQASRDRIPGWGLMQEETVPMLALRCSRRRTRASAAAPGAGALPSFLRENSSTKLQATLQGLVLGISRKELVTNWSTRIVTLAPRRRPSSGEGNSAGVDAMKFFNAGLPFHIAEPGTGAVRGNVAIFAPSVRKTTVIHGAGPVGFLQFAHYLAKREPCLTLAQGLHWSPLCRVIC